MFPSKTLFTTFFTFSKQLLQFVTTLYQLSYYSKIRCNILILNNTKLPIITDPISVIGFLRDADFTEHS
jgi:hypothetical protein